MNKRIRSAFGCAVLFILSGVILKYGGDRGLPSEDYGMSVIEVFNMYSDAPSAVTSVSAEHILNLSHEAAPVTDKPCDVLPPVLVPPQTTAASDIN